MVPQGATAFNTGAIDKLVAEINSVETCSALQAVVDEAFASLGALKAALDEELAALEPILALLTAPGANLTAIVTWIQDYINSVLRPMVKPYETIIAQIQALTQKIAELTAAIQAAMSRITSCSITIPAI